MPTGGKKLSKFFLLVSAVMKDEERARDVLVMIYV